MQSDAQMIKALSVFFAVLLSGLNKRMLGGVFD